MKLLLQQGSTLIIASIHEYSYTTLLPIIAYISYHSKSSPFKHEVRSKTLWLTSSYTQQQQYPHSSTPSPIPSTFTLSKWNSRTYLLLAYWVRSCSRTLGNVSQTPHKISTIVKFPLGNSFLLPHTCTIQWSHVTSLPFNLQYTWIFLCVSLYHFVALISMRYKWQWSFGSESAWYIRHQRSGDWHICALRDEVAQ